MGNLYNKWGSSWPSLFKINILVHNPLEKYGEMQMYCVGGIEMDLSKIMLSFPALSGGTKCCSESV